MALENENSKLSAEYQSITARHDTQLKTYRDSIEALKAADIKKLMQAAEKFGLDLDITTGRIRYGKDFKPLELCVEICYVRHGKTAGNTEPRTFQGFVDYQENQLNDIGKGQAERAADMLETMIKDKNWEPDIIISSPLGRAIDTATVFTSRHPNIIYKVVHNCAEMHFGAWDGIKVIDIDYSDVAHLFHTDHNAVCKSSGSHKVRKNEWKGSKSLKQFNFNLNEIYIPPENFLNLIQRQADALREIEILSRSAVGPSAGDRKTRAVIYGHSMAGAAISILLGYGKEDKCGYLCFDGSYTMPNAAPTFLIPQDSISSYK